MCLSINGVCKPLAERVEKRVAVYWVSKKAFSSSMISFSRPASRFHLIVNSRSRMSSPMRWNREKDATKISCVDECALDNGVFEDLVLFDDWVSVL
jgi:hypothetical protein